MRSVTSLSVIVGCCLTEGEDDFSRNGVAVGYRLARANPNFFLDNIRYGMGEVTFDMYLRYHTLNLPHPGPAQISISMSTVL